MFQCGFLTKTRRNNLNEKFQFLSAELLQSHDFHNYSQTGTKYLRVAELKPDFHVAVFPATTMLPSGFCGCTCAAGGERQ